MRTRIIAGRLRRVALLGTLGPLLAFLAVPFTGAGNASAYPGFTASVTCSATNGQSGSRIMWDWMQGGYAGTIVASGSVLCPDIAGSGTSSATATGTQPASADTLWVQVDAAIGGFSGCGDTNYKLISFTPGSPVSMKLSVTGKSPCSYSSGKKDTVTVDGSLQS